MSSVQFKIEVESYNGRSDQIAVKLIVDNSGGERIKLISLTPNVPFGVQIEERRDTSQESKKEKAIDLCLELTDILDGYLENNYEIIKVGRISLAKEKMNEILKVKSFFLVYASLFKQTLLSQELRAINRKLTSIKFTVQNLADAEWAYDKWFANLSDD
ncbi:TPA: hypothetical protein ACTZ5N_003416, partial [Bacillus cereus]